MSKVFAMRLGSIGVPDHATPWLTIRNALQKTACEQFRVDQTNIVAYILLQVFTTIFYFASRYYSLRYFPSQLTIGSSILGMLNPLLLGWWIIIIRLVNRWYNDPKSSSSRFNQFLIWLDSVYVVGSCIAISFIIITIGHNGPCPHPSHPHQNWGCNRSSAHQMPGDYMMASLTVPLLLAVIVKGAKWEAIIIGFLIICWANIFTMFYWKLTNNSVETFFIYLPVCLLVLYENRRQSIALFLLAQNQENLLRENERLAEEMHANELRHMIGNVAHDLKTPLSAFVSGVDFILSVLSDLKSATIIESEVERGLTAILDSVQNMKNVNDFMLMTINRCIDYTKASQGLKLVPRMETINLLDVINLPLKCMRDMQQDKQIELKLMSVCSSVSEHIITDKQWLQENILCLLSNAVKYSSSGSVSISVGLIKTPLPTIGSKQCVANTSFKPERHICVEIEDSGIGISEDMMANLFNPFKQAQRLAGGTGLGLYSLAKRIEALGGSYGVKNRSDKASGSVFWFTIPYRPDDTKQIISTFSSPRTLYSPSDEVYDNPLSSSQEGNHNTVKSVDEKLNILLVDDSLSILKMSSMMLRQQGHTISTAENGAIAVDRVISALTSGQSYDVVLMDLQMPVMDGLEATSRIRAFEKTMMNANNNPIHQLIIGVSACSDNETMEAAFEAGIDAFIPKPFTMQSFKDTCNGLFMSR